MTVAMMKGVLKGMGKGAEEPSRFGPAKGAAKGGCCDQLELPDVDSEDPLVQAQVENIRLKAQLAEAEARLKNQGAKGKGAALPGLSGGDQAQMSGKYKTEYCKFFMVGKCTKGDLCTYIHFA